MGLEVRRVPANWKHPRQRCYHSPWMGGCSEARQAGDGRCLQPLKNKDYETAVQEWELNNAAWEEGTHQDLEQTCEPRFNTPSYEEWHGSPSDPTYYRPRWTSEPTHYQIYENVSEGTPVTPVFATKEDLIEHLVKHGTAWSSGRRWTQKNAEAFVEDEWAPTLIITNGVSYGPETMGDLKERT